MQASSKIVDTPQFVVSALTIKTILVSLPCSSIYTVTRRPVVRPTDSSPSTMSSSSSNKIRAFELQSKCVELCAMETKGWTWN